MNSRQISTLSLLLVMLIFASGCTELDDQTQHQEVMTGFPDFELYSSRVTYTKEGVLQFSISAKEITRFEKNDLLLLKDSVQADFYNSLGKHTAKLTADAGEVFERDRKLLARGNVVVESDTGYVLYADTLYYDPTEELVRSDGFVTLISDLDSLSGTGFYASPDLGTWEIKNTSGESWRKVEIKE